MRIVLVIGAFIFLVCLEYARGLQVKEMTEHINKLANQVVYDRHRLDILTRDR